MTFVIDASVTMAWCFDDEAAPGTDALLARLSEEGALVPHLWEYEVANVLLVAEQRGRISEAQAGRFTSLLAQLPIVRGGDIGTGSTILALGRRHGISAYDAAYLAVAEQAGIGLATLDGRLRGAARSAGVPTLP